MYLNQFTNTKRIKEGTGERLVLHAYSEYRLRGIPSIFVCVCFFFCVCLFYKMTYDILFHTLSASKMSSTSYNSTKKRGRKKTNHSCTKKNKLSPPKEKLYSISTFAEYLQGFKYIHPLLSIESRLIRVNQGLKLYIFI